MSRFPHTLTANRIFAWVLTGITLLFLGFLCAGVISAVRQPTAPKGLPPLPLTMPSVLGPIEIKRVINLQCDTGNGPVPALGCFSGDDRTVSIRDSIPLIVAWQAYYHEGVHCALYYAAIHFKSAEMEDKLADVIANQQVMYMLTATKP